MQEKNTQEPLPPDAVKISTKRALVSLLIITAIAVALLFLIRFTLL